MGLEVTFPFVAAGMGSIYETFGHATEAVGASNICSRSTASIEHPLPAAVRLHKDIENPGALSDVSKSPDNILVGSMSHFVSM